MEQMLGMAQLKLGMHHYRTQPVIVIVTEETCVRVCVQGDVAVAGGESGVTDGDAAEALIKEELRG